MIYPNGFVTVRKLEEMVDDSQNWEVYAESKITHERIRIKDRADLREYGFYWDYTICYDFIGDWNEYNAPKDKDAVLFNKKYGDIEIRVTKKDDEISAEIVKWENNKPSAEDLPSCFVLAYWDKDDDLVFVGDRFFKYIPWYMLPKMYLNLKRVQKILDDDED